MKPVLLLISGMLNTDAVWARVAPLLADAAEIRMADVCSQDSIAAMARDAWARVADVPATTPLAVCGFSMGGYVTLEMLAHPQRRIAAIGLLDTSARPESPEGAAMRDKTIAAIGNGKLDKVVEGVLVFGTHGQAQAQPALMQELRELMLGIGPEAAIRQNLAIKGRGDYRAALARLDQPVVVMCGRDDRVTPPALSEELKALIPNARLEWIENAGHMTPIEQPVRVAELLRGLIPT